MKGLIKYYSFVFLLFFVTAINAQSQKVYNLDNDDASLVVNYKDLLLSACDEDMNKAFNIWMETLGAIESYASAIGFEKIKGVKMYVKILWDKNGYIDHIGYYLQPNSRFVTDEEMKKFLRLFALEYKCELRHNENFHHYGSVSFPTYYKGNPIAPKMVKIFNR